MMIGLFNVLMDERYIVFGLLASTLFAINERVLCDTLPFPIVMFNDLAFILSLAERRHLLFWTKVPLRYFSESNKGF